MRPTSSNFFDEPQGAAILKHGILKGYLPVFVRMTGSTAPEHRVAYLDGFAGPGRYEDGSPGSPALAIEIAEAVSAVDKIEGYLVERDTVACGALRDFVAEHQPEWSVFEGTLDEHFDVILGLVGDKMPLFAFLDPFGLFGVPIARLEQLLERGGRMVKGANPWRVGGAPTEVLLNFSRPGLRRNGGHLTSTKTNPGYLKSRETILRSMKVSLGGDWWEPIWRTESWDREEQILTRYKERVVESAEKGGWRVFEVPVGDQYLGTPSYHLLLLTQHVEGPWKFNDAVSNAMEAQREFCEAQAAGASDQLTLDLEGDTTIGAYEAEAMIEEIARNIDHLLKTGTKVVVPRNHINEVYGWTLGIARERHVREALNRMYDQGRIATSPKGEKRLSRFEIRAAAPQSPSPSPNISS